MASLDYISRQISTYVKQEKASRSKEVKMRMAKKRNQALGFFKVMILLLGPISGRDAIRIRSHAEEVMEGTGAPVGATKAWDPYRTYEKRLVMVASRDKGVEKGALEVQKQKQSAVQAEDTEREDSPVSSDAAPTATRINNSKKRPRPVESDAAQEKEDEAEDDEDNDAGVNDQASAGGIDLGEELDMEVDLGLDEDGEEIQVDIPASQLGPERSRSVSIEPNAKRRKMIKRY